MVEDEVESLVDVYDCPKPHVSSGGNMPSFKVMKVWYALLHMEGEFMSREVMALARELGIDVSSHNIGVVMKKLCMVGYFKRERIPNKLGTWMYSPTELFHCKQREYLDDS